MGILSKSEKKELKEIAKSPKLREDIRVVLSKRHNPFLVDDKINLDRLLVFLTEYNYFVNHISRPFKKMVTRFNKF